MNSLKDLWSNFQEIKYCMYAQLATIFHNVMLKMKDKCIEVVLQMFGKTK